jgi:hypothetical protein
MTNPLGAINTPFTSQSESGIGEPMRMVSVLTVTRFIKWGNYAYANRQNMSLMDKPGLLALKA